MHCRGAARWLVHAASLLMLAVRSTSLLPSRGLYLAHRAFSGATAALSAADTSRTDSPQQPKGRVSASVVQAEKGASTVELPLHPPRGTRDFYPEEQRLKLWLFDIWRKVARLHGFEEYDAPVVEHLDLYIRKAGEEISQQLYSFEDKSGRKLALRPEMTPSLARMVISRPNHLTLPLKWFSIPQCWRYERMARGRRREHYQWNMDILGVRGIEAEAELLSAIVHGWEVMGLNATHVGIKVNSRRLLNDLMREVGIPEEKWIATCILVDKLEKVSLESLRGEVESVGLSMENMERLASLLSLTSLEDFAHRLGPSEGVQELSQLLDRVEAYGIRPYIEFDPSVVRGLAYYTGVVFEGFDRKRTHRAICGGGRYDHLLDSFGATTPIPAVGFGFGDVVILELLAEMGGLPDVSSARVKVVAYAMTHALQHKLIALVASLRRAGVDVDVVMNERRIRDVFQKANKMQARHVLVLGEEEDRAGEVAVKDMASGTQSRIPVGDLVDYLAQGGADTQAK